MAIDYNKAQRKIQQQRATAKPQQQYRSGSGFSESVSDAVGSIYDAVSSYDSSSSCGSDSSSSSSCGD